MAEDERQIQERLIDEFFNPRYFPTQHDFAARAEIEQLRKRVAELEGKSTQKGSTVKGKSE